MADSLNGWTKKCTNCGKPATASSLSGETIICCPYGDGKTVCEHWEPRRAIKKEAPRRYEDGEF